MSSPDHPPGTSASDPYWTPRPPRKRTYEVTVTIRVEADDPDDAMGAIEDGDLIKLDRIEEVGE